MAKEKTQAEKKAYTIAGKTYTQRPLVLGQIQQLLKLLKDISEQFPDAPEIPRMSAIGNLDDLENVFEKNKWKERRAILSFIGILGENITRAMAIVLIPEGKEIRDRNIDEIEHDLFDCPPEIALEVITDFFFFSRNSALVKQMRSHLKQSGKQTTLQGQSSASSTSSPRGIS